MTTIDDRYTVVRRLGDGSQSMTWVARADDDAREVVLKELRFERLDSWKSLELFEREADVLRELSHPQIPAFVEAFQWIDRGRPRFFLVQELVAGTSLHEEIKDGRVFDEGDVRRFLLSMLEVLAYLHERIPPVVHRDIKPANILRRVDGSYALVDFGGAQVVLAGATGGSTVVGTTGYMPPEQLAGRARPESDLYALGATAIHMITGCHPRELPTKRMHIQWRDRARDDLRRPLLDIVDRLTEPVVEDRYPDARHVRAALLDESPAASGKDHFMVPEPLQQAVGPIGDRWRVRELGHGIVFDFGPRPRMHRSQQLIWTLVSLLLMLVGYAITSTGAYWGLAACGIGLAALARLAAAGDDGPRERITIYPGRRYLLQRADAGQRPTEVRGQLQRTELRGTQVFVEGDEDEHILGADLHPDLVKWLHQEIEHELHKGRLA